MSSVMNRVCLAAVFLSVCLVPHLLAQPSGRVPVPFRILTAEGGFTCLMPDSAAMAKDTLNLGGAGGLTDRVFYTSINDGVFYQVSYFDYADTLVRKFKSDTAFLNSGRDGIVKTVGGKLQTERLVKLGTYTGRDLSIETLDGKLYRVQIYMIGRRFFQIQIVVPKGKFLTGDADGKFFDSFMLVIK